MSPRAEKWEVREHADASVDLYRGRKRMLSDISYVEVLAYLRKHLGIRHRVFRVESDGYRTDITRNVQRKAL